MIHEPVALVTELLIYLDDVCVLKTKNDLTTDGVLFLHQKWGRLSPSDVVGKIALGDNDTPFSPSDTVSTLNFVGNSAFNPASTVNTVSGFGVDFRAVFDYNFNLLGPNNPQNIEIKEAGLLNGTEFRLISRVVLPIPIIKTPDVTLTARFRHIFKRP